MKLQFLPRTRSFFKSKHTKSFAETDAESNCGKWSPKQFQGNKKKKQIRKKNQITKENKKQIFHQRIYRYSIKSMKKTMRIYEYKESDMKWPKKYTKQFCPQEMDNDVESDSEIIEYQIQKCRRNLLEQIQRRKSEGANVSSK